MAKIAKEQRRAARRTVRRWRDAMAERSPEWARRRLGPVLHYSELLLVDHGIFRLAYLNLHAVDAFAWRAAQPAPHQIASLARRGVRTIVNLRGVRYCGSYWLEQKACMRANVRLVDYQVRSRAAPSKEEIRGARDIFESVEYPILMHCKSGADRAGLMSALYLILKRGVPAEEAKRQLSLRFGHIRQADTGILDAFFDSYIACNAKTPIGFMDWVETVYDPEELKRSFAARGWANGLVNTILRRE